MGDRMRRGVVALLCGAGVVLSAGPATAAGEGLSVEIVGSGVSSAGDGADVTIFEEGVLAPGSVVTGSVRVTSPWSGSLSARAVDVRDLELGCVEPEIEAGDDSCGASEGELAAHVDVHVDSRGERVWSGPLHALAADGSKLLAVEGDVPVRLDWTATVRRSAGNEVQSDLVAFALEFSIEADNRASVLGASHDKAVVAAIGGLAATGWQLSQVATAAALAISIGATAVLVAKVLRRFARC